MKLLENPLFGGALVLLFIGFLGWMLFGSVGNPSGLSSTSNQQISLTTDPSSPTAGNVNFIITVRDEKGNPVKNAKVFFDVNMTTMNMGTQHGTANSQQDGTYTATGKLSMRGAWRIATKVTFPGGKVMDKNFDINAN